MFVNRQLLSAIINMVYVFPSEKVVVVKFVASSLASFFNLLISKYGHTILPTFLASSKAGKKCE